MRYQHSVLYRLLALLLALAVLTLAGCAPKEDRPEATTEPSVTDPTVPEPTDPPVQTAHGKLVEYLKTKGAVVVEENTYTFTMKTEDGKILWEYKNDSTDITVTLADGAAMHPVVVRFAVYDAWADVEAATYSNKEHQLSNFRCGVPSMAEAVKNLTTTAVWSCFTQAAKAMEPAGVNLVDLGFTNYYG